jgi:flagellar protein FlaG
LIQPGIFYQGLDMNILPLGPSVAARPDDRSVQNAEPAPSAAASAPAAAAGKAAEPSSGELSAAVKKINDSMSASAQSLEFSIDQDSERIVVKVIDQATRQIVRQIPSAEALEIAKSIDQMQQGLLIRQKA